MPLRGDPETPTNAISAFVIAGLGTANMASLARETRQRTGVDPGGSGMMTTAPLSVLNTSRGATLRRASFLRQI